MPWIMQMAGFALFLIGIGIALWISIWVLGILFAIVVAMVLGTHVRQFLVEKGILNPTPGIPPEPYSAEPQAPVIEGDFERVEQESKTKIDN